MDRTLRCIRMLPRGIVVGVAANALLMIGPPAGAVGVTQVLSPVTVMRDPVGLAVAPDGTAYVAAPGTHNLFRVDPDGSVEEILAGTSPRLLALAPDGTLYLGFDSYVRSLDPSGALQSVYSQNNTYVEDLAVSSDGSLALSRAQQEDDVRVYPPTLPWYSPIGSSGDGLGHTLDNPWGLAFDAGGNLFVTGSVTDNAFKVTPGGVVTQIIDATGDGLGHPLDDPRSVATDAAGNVYVAGYRSHNVFQITPAGAITQIIDASGDGAGAALAFPLDVTVDANGDVIVVGASSDNAFRVSGGTITKIIGSSGDGSAPLDRPVAVAADGLGNVYVLGEASQNLFRIAPGGAVTRILHAGVDAEPPSYYLASPQRIAVRDGTLWVTGYGSRTVVQASPGGSVIDVFDSDLLGTSYAASPRAVAVPEDPQDDPIVCGGNGAFDYDYVASIDAPLSYSLILDESAPGVYLSSVWDCLVDAAGNVYLVSLGSDRVYRVAPGGPTDLLVDPTGDGLGNGLDGPYRLALGPDGTLYVAGYVSDNVLGVDGSGVVSLAIDASGDGQGHALDSPIGVDVDADGNLYVAGYGSDNVFRVTPTGVVTQLADASGDGQGNALDGPFDVAVGGDGTVYVAGELSDNVFAIEPGGDVRLVMDATGDGAGHPLDAPNDLALDGSVTLYVVGEDSENVFRVDLAEPAAVPVPSSWLVAAAALLAALGRKMLRPARGLGAAGSPSGKVHRRRGSSC